ncbi:hypothetical protein EJB05_01893, partial [Eragrostis curvula]
MPSRSRATEQEATHWFWEAGIHSLPLIQSIKAEGTRIVDPVKKIASNKINDGHQAVVLDMGIMNPAVNTTYTEGFYCKGTVEAAGKILVDRDNARASN